MKKQIMKWCPRCKEPLIFKKGPRISDDTPSIRGSNYYVCKGKEKHHLLIWVRA